MLFISISNLLFTLDCVLDSLVAAATIRGGVFISFDKYVGVAIIQGRVYSKGVSFRGNTVLINVRPKH